MDTFESQVRGLIGELQTIGAVLSCDGIRLICKRDPDTLRAIEKCPVAVSVGFLHQRTGAACVAISFNRQ